MYLVHSNCLLAFFYNVVSLQPARCANQIEEVCKEIEKTINQTIQNTLNTLEKDCEKIADMVDKKLTIDTCVYKIIIVLNSILRPFPTLLTGNQLSMFSL